MYSAPSALNTLPKKLRGSFHTVAILMKRKGAIYTFEKKTPVSIDSIEQAYKVLMFLLALELDGKLRELKGNEYTGGSKLDVNFPYIALGQETLKEIATKHELFRE